MLRVMPDVVGGPLSQLVRHGLPVWLESEGYAGSTASQVLAVARGLSQWMDDRGVGIDGLDVGVLDSFAAAHGPGVAGRAIVEQRLPTIRRFLMGLGLVPGAVRPLKRPRPPGGAPPLRVDAVVEAELAQWGYWQREMRGISEGCIRTRRHWVSPLVASLPQIEGRVCWEGCDVDALNAFVAQRCRGWSQASGVLILDATRSLWGWAVATGRVQRDLRGGILRSKGTRAALPKGLTPSDVASLLDVCDLSTPAGIRDRAVILVLSRLGLRAGEAAGLGLDDIDWNGGRLSVVGKGRRLDLPLPVDVGQALVDWLEVRPRSADRRVFIRVRKPAEGLSPAGISGIVKHRARDAGLGVVHAHRLRHSAATNVVGAGGDLVEAQELLGHRSAESTLVYARTDLSSLRILTVSWGRWPR